MSFARLSARANSPRNFNKGKHRFGALTTLKPCLALTCHNSTVGSGRNSPLYARLEPRPEKLRGQNSAFSFYEVSDRL